MLKVVTWKWSPPKGYRSNFDGSQCTMLYEALQRNSTVPFEFIVITDNPADVDNSIKTVPLWANPAPHYGSHTRPNCFVRLKMFSEEMKNIVQGDRILSLDLDTVITGNIDHILKDESNFKIWYVDGEKSPCNGSMILHKLGTRPDIWTKFNPQAVDPICAYRKSKQLVGSDQAWIAQNLNADTKFFGKVDGVYSFRCHIKPFDRGRLPGDTKIVFFHGEHDPWHKDVQIKYPWVRQHYRRNTPDERHSITSRVEQQRGECGVRNVLLDPAGSFQNGSGI